MALAVDKEIEGIPEPSGTDAEQIRTLIRTSLKLSARAGADDQDPNLRVWLKGACKINETVELLSPLELHPRWSSCWSW